MEGASIQGLRVFLRVVERGSLSAAGRELGISQPAVSNHLRALEERFGLALLARGGRLKTTPAGECLARHARRVLEEVAALEAEMSRHAGPRGRLVLGASSTPAELLLPRLAARFTAAYPEVALDVRVADTDETLAALLGREVEVAILGCRERWPGLVTRVVERDELVPVAAVGDPLVEGGEVAPAELAERPFVLRERGSATRRAVEDGLEKAGVEVRVAMELGSNAAVAGAVAEGAGVSVLPARTVEGRPMLKRVDVGGLRFSRPFVLAFEKGRPLSPAAEAFVNVCTERC